MDPGLFASGELPRTRLLFLAAVLVANYHHSFDEPRSAATTTMRLLRIVSVSLRAIPRRDLLATDRVTTEVLLHVLPPSLPRGIAGPRFPWRQSCSVAVPGMPKTSALEGLGHRPRGVLPPESRRLCCIILSGRNGPLNYLDEISRRSGNRFPGEVTRGLRREDAL